MHCATVQTCLLAAPPSLILFEMARCLATNCTGVLVQLVAKHPTSIVITAETPHKCCCPPAQDVFVTPGHLAIVMEHCNGGDVASLISRRLRHGVGFFPSHFCMAADASLSLWFERNNTCSAASTTTHSKACVQ